jgi:hypothetical protein
MDIDFDTAEMVQKMTAAHGLADKFCAKVAFNVLHKAEAGALVAVPKEELNLRNSIGVDMDPDGLGGTLATHDPKSEDGYNYAAIQHENLEFEHPGKDSEHPYPGFPKYIENPMRVQVARLDEECKGTAEALFPT